MRLQQHKFISSGRSRQDISRVFAGLTGINSNVLFCGQFGVTCSLFGAAILKRPEERGATITRADWSTAHKTIFFVASLVLIVLIVWFNFFGMKGFASFM